MTILDQLPDEQDVDVTAITAKPSAGDRFDAAWKSETIRTDAWWYTGRMRADITKDVYSHLSDDAKERVFDGYSQIWRQPDIQDQTAAMESILLAEVAKEQSGGPRWNDTPSTEEEISAEVLRRRKAELAEADAVLGIDGGGVAGFMGTFTRAMTDQTSVAMAPLGLQGSLTRIMAGEAALGMAGEAAILPREFAVADELGLEKPKVLPRLAMGAVGGAAFGGLIAGTPRAYRYLRTKRDATAAARQAGTDPVDHELAVDEEYARQTGTETPAAAMEREKPGRGAGPLKFSDFDFTPSGNASSKNNRIGYVFGRLLEGGIPPHLAAGGVGNFMVESGVTLNARAVGDGGHAHGIAQWNDRASALRLFAKSKGKDPADLDLQIDFFFHEIKTTEAGNWAKIMRAGSAREAALLFSKYYERPGTPHNSRRAAYADMIFNQYQAGNVPKWKKTVISPNDGGEFTGYTTSRGYTTTGTVTAGDNFRVDVKYEVVDASLLQRASGDLQPRDRSRAASDEQIAEIAARLDPARLMPSPEADRGAPIVGPDNVVESGNGRYLAIQRAAVKHGDRFDAYKKAITDAGYEIPAGVDTPVLIARRTSDLEPDARRQFIRNANTSAVARMSATERAASDAASIDNEAVGLFVPGETLGGKANKAFVARTLATMPQAERAALVDAKGALNAEGITRIKQALFARAYDAPDILARYAETEAGDLRALVDALEDAAPAWAAMRADIAAGLVRAELDITENMLDAMRLIASARQIARKEGTAAANVIEELLADIDLLEGALHPLTAALVRKFAPSGKAASKDKIASFLTRYAHEARKIGTTDSGLFGDGPGPAQILRAIDEKTFGDLPDDLMPAAPRANETAVTIDLAAMPDRAFADGANSPDAVAGDDLLAAGFRDDVTDISMRGGHHGQIDMTVNLKRDGKLAGRIDYSVYEGVPHIQMIDVDGGMRRQGVASELLRSLQRKYPDQEIQWGSLTKDGASLYNATRFNDIDQTGGIDQVMPEIKARYQKADADFIESFKAGFEGDIEAVQIAFYKAKGELEKAKAMAETPPKRLIDQARHDPLGDGLDAEGSLDAAVDPALRDPDLSSALRNELDAFRATSGDLEFEQPDGSTFSTRDILNDLDSDADLNDVIDICASRGSA